jgi:hypothetical protein
VVTPEVKQTAVPVVSATASAVATAPVAIAAAHVSDSPAVSKRATKPVVAIAEQKPAVVESVKSTPAVKKPDSGIVKKPESGKPATAPAARPVEDTLAAVLSAKADTLPQAAAVGVLPGFDAEVYHLDANVHAYGNTAQITVSIDETIGHYADWLGIAAWHIRRLNNMGNTSNIRIGQRLAIPGTPAAIDAFNQRRLEYHMAVEEDFYSQFKVAEVKPHTLARGETLWDICNGEEPVPLWLLQKYNKHTDLGNLVPSVTIWIPAIVEKGAADFTLKAAESGGMYPSHVEPLLPSQKPLRRTP